MRLAAVLWGYIETVSRGTEVWFSGSVQVAGKWVRPALAVPSADAAYRILRAYARAANATLVLTDGSVRPGTPPVSFYVSISHTEKE